jgi:nitroreductase
MDIYQAVRSRHSVRAFLPDPVDPAALRRVFEAARWAPSGGNLQPWNCYLVGGEELTAIKTTISERLSAMPNGEAERDYAIYPSPLGSPYRERRYENGEQLYAAAGIPRTDKPARMVWRARNYAFFDAPVALFCYLDRQMLPPQWSDLGMYLQTVMLLLRAEGLGSCAQEAWSAFPAAIAEHLKPPSEWMLFCAMAIGHPDTGHIANSWRATRAQFDESIHTVGMELPA